MPQTLRLPNAVLLATCAVTALVRPAPAPAQGNLTLYCNPQIEWCQLLLLSSPRPPGSRWR